MLLKYMEDLEDYPGAVEMVVERGLGPQSREALMMERVDLGRAEGLYEESRKEMFLFAGEQEKPELDVALDRKRGDYPIGRDYKGRKRWVGRAQQVLTQVRESGERRVAVRRIQSKLPRKVYDLLGEREWGARGWMKYWMT